ncbi:hypothetical protein JOF56_008392 [Kibdelosporangium banguiense]|uniref:Uncharacterized protein n=1 Tax=Kibdelosporangium banguiense TaxID=1365924 RepID=A0ABS4TUE5_9PSEU|nr:hypothetical protein [Kibdelosporangium banguiense]MBP2328007.1 hypothetical protein [Kibdelosporangium banguiense]
MSSVTAASYVVVESAEVQRRREQRAAWEQYASVRAELAALQAEARAYRSVYGDLVEEVPAGQRARANSSRTKLERATADAEAILASHRNRLRESVARAQRLQAEQLRTADAPVAAPMTYDRPVTRAESSTVDVEVEDGERAKARAERVAKLLANLPAEASQQTRRACDRLAAEILGDVPEPRARMLLADLEKRIRREKQAAERVAEAHTALKLLRTRVEVIVVDPAADHDAVEALCGEIDGLISARAAAVPTDLAGRVARLAEQTERVAAARIALQALRAKVEVLLTDPAADQNAAHALQRDIDGLINSRAAEVPADLAGKVADVAEQADLAFRRKLVAGALRMSFAELGYEVSEGFETVLADQGVAYTNLPNAEGYGLKVLLDRDREAVRTQVVRSAGKPVRATGEDTDAQKSFCDDYPTLLARLRRHGVKSTELGARPPGTLAVATVADELLPVARQQAQQVRYQERNL